MSTALHVAALVVALLSVPTVGGVTAWGLAGGDGEQHDPVLLVTAALVGFGSLYNAVTCWTAFWGLPEWRWWLMFVAPVAGLVGVALAGSDEPGSTGDRMVGLALQLVLAVPALLLLAAGVPA